MTWQPKPASGERHDPLCAIHGFTGQCSCGVSPTSPFHDPRCPNCDIPLRAITRVVDGRCADTEACHARRSLGPGHLINPEGVTPFGRREGGTE